MAKIKETKSVYTKREGTKNGWVLQSVVTETVTDIYWRRVEESAPYFRRMGGSETLQRTYTFIGYRATRVISKDPTRSIKIVREYEVTK